MINFKKDIRIVYAGSLHIVAARRSGLVDRASVETVELLGSLHMRLTHCGATSFSRSLSSIARRRLGMSPCGRRIMMMMMITPNIANRYS